MRTFEALTALKAAVNENNQLMSKFLTLVENYCDVTKDTLEQNPGVDATVANAIRQEAEALREGCDHIRANYAGMEKIVEEAPIRPDPPQAVEKKGKRRS